MPDKELKTVSATEMGAILNIPSAYETRWMVYQRFRGLDLPDEPENFRMTIGRRLQPVILEIVAEHYRLDIEHNDDDVYTRHPTLPIGCTTDGDVICPTRGVGIVESKCVDWQVFKNTWAFRDGQLVAAPKHIEIQVHTQMLVKDASWGVIAVLVGGNEFHMLERHPSFPVIRAITREAEGFLDDVANAREPEVFGTERELKCLSHLYVGLDEEKVLDLRAEGEDGLDVEEMARMYDEATSQKRDAEKEAKRLKAKMLQRIKDHNVVLTPSGVLRIARNGVLRWKDYLEKEGTNG